MDSASRHADRAVIAHLLDKYGMDNLVNMIQSVSASSKLSPSPSSIHPSVHPCIHTLTNLFCPAPSSHMSANTYLSETGFVPTSISASNSPLAFSDAGSVAGSLYEAVTAAETNTTTFFSTAAPVHSNSRRGRGAAAGVSASSSRVSPSPSIRKHRPPVDCPFCSELNISVSIARKADLKRHLTRFHNESVQWICSVPGCQQAFDFKAGFEAHLKDSHKGIHLSSEDAMVFTCPQVVFACGFSNCKQIFEADGDSQAEQKAQEYFNHITKHMADEGMTQQDWSYSVRFRNLMRQRNVEAAWKQRNKESKHQRLGWRPATSAALRKVLETRHIRDPALLVHWAANLGIVSSPQQTFTVPTLPEGMTLPLRDTCTMNLPGHRPGTRPSSGHSRSHSHHQQQQAQWAGLPSTQGQTQLPVRSPLQSPDTSSHHGYFPSGQAASSQYPTPVSTAPPTAFQSPVFGSDTSQASSSAGVFWTGFGDLGNYASHTAGAVHGQHYEGMDDDQDHGDVDMNMGHHGSPGYPPSTQNMHGYQ
jgi:hypothetical protein